MGPSEKDQLEMLKTIGFESLDELVTSTVPANIRLEEPMELGPYSGVLRRFHFVQTRRLRESRRGVVSFPISSTTQARTRPPRCPRPRR